MKVVELLTLLRKQGIRLWADGDRLSYDAPQGGLTAELRDLVLTHKPELLRFLQEVRVGGVDHIEPVARRGLVRLSFAQERLWFLNQLEPGNPFYTMPAAIRLRGPLDVDALQRSLAEVIRRHESLRTTFELREGYPVQVIAPVTAVEVTVTDLSMLPPDAREDAAWHIIENEAQRAFDLARGPLFCSELVRLAGEHHILVLTVHHIVSDGWSTGILLRELSDLYSAFAARCPSPLTEPRFQYADFAAWQRKALQGAALEEQIAYWREQLADLPALNLPTDRPRPAVQSYRGSSLRVKIEPCLYRQLTILSQSEGVSLFMLLLAVFQVLLARYTGQEDIVVGTGIANRNHPDTEGLIGFFVNVLVMRSNASGNPIFREFLAHVREVALAAYAHQDVPFEQVVYQLQPERDLSRNPLFQVMLILQNTPRTAEVPSGLAFELLEAQSTTSKFDLWVSLMEGPDGLSGVIEYSTDLFNEDTIISLFERYRLLLEAVVAHPEARLSSLPLTTPLERQILIDGGRASNSIPVIETLQQRFERQVASRPESVALVDTDGNCLTYTEINVRANQIAHLLRECGVGPESRVGVLIERSSSVVVAILGVLKAGGAYIPIDSSTPANRANYTLHDAQVLALLTQEHLLPGIEADRLRVICIDSDASLIARQPKVDPSSTSSPQNLAYVIYTSGTTGSPKGTLVTHANVQRLLSATHAWFGFDERDVWTLFHSTAFDFSVWELWGALGFGGRLVVVPAWVSRAPKSFAELIAQQNVTILNQTPSAFRQLIPAARQVNLDALRLVIFGGEELDLQSLLPWFKRYGDDTPQLVNMYGITETTVHVTYRPLTRGDAEIPNRSRIGRAIPDLNLHILDASLQPLPIGVPGQLYVGGAGVARGYLGRPGLTAERFIPDPFAASHGERLYRTGDLARRLPDGDIEYLGRSDQQVKIRGFRIEPGEIEAVLRTHEAITDAAVVVREDIRLDRRLVAYIVPRPASPADGTSDSHSTLDLTQVRHWQQVFDQVYDAAISADPTFNITGWTSSYTGSPISEPEMREWVGSTVQAIAQLGPQRVLEVGCGTGLLMYKLATMCNDYIGTDISQKALQGLESHLQSMDNMPCNIRLLHRSADDFSGLEDEAVDTVIINSVAQYFPGLDYLVNILRQAARVVAPGGHIFVGDVRSLALLPAFHLSLELDRTPADVRIGQVRQLVADRLRHERELALDPALFLALRQIIPAIAHVEIALKRGSFHNELTGFRYDVVLLIASTTSSSPTSPFPLVWQNWSSEGMNLDGLTQVLQTANPPYLALSHIPNGRIVNEIAAIAAIEALNDDFTVADLKATAESLRSRDAVDPERLASIAEQLGYSVRLSWARSAQDGSFDALIFLPEQAAFHSVDVMDAFPASSAAPLEGISLANNPVQGSIVLDLVPKVRQYLEERLPMYMIPTSFVPLSALPLTTNGKIDRAALPHPAPDRARATDVPFAPPTTHAERVLAEIWCDVLGMETVGIHDNFFVLGGDSLRSIQVLDRSNRAGIHLTPKQVFQHQTIAELARCADSAHQIRAIHEPIVGPVPLLPAQHWFFEHGLPSPYYWHGISINEIAGPVAPTLLEEAMQHVLAHHDALRARFTFADGRWQQRFVSPDESVSLDFIDLSNVADDAKEAAIRAAVDELRDKIDIIRGPVLRVGLITLGEGKSGRLVTVVHHLLIDGRSQQIIEEDAMTAYEQLSHGEPVRLPAKTTSVKEWAEALIDYTQSDDAQRELAFWLDLPWRKVEPLPLDFPENRGDNRRIWLQGLIRALDKNTTHCLLHSVPEVCNVHFIEIVQTALVRAFTKWTGTSTLLIGRIGHGREPMFDDLDVSRTVGWFATNKSPTLLEWTPGSAYRDTLETVKARVRAIRHQGLGYDILRYMSPNQDVAQQLRNLPTSEIALYYAPFESPKPERAGIFFPSAENIGEAEHPESKPHFLLILGLFFCDGCLEMRWGYFSNVHRRETIEQVAGWVVEELQALVVQCLSDNPAPSGNQPEPAAVRWEAPSKGPDRIQT